MEKSQRPVIWGRRLSAVVYAREARQAFDHPHRLYSFWIDPNPAIHEEYGTVYLLSNWHHHTEA